MADNDSVRQRIISSVFTKLNASGHEENYVSHIKIWEEAGSDEGGKKPRYILLSKASNGAGFIHKSKLNSNGSFSVGKTWKLQELRGVEVVNPLSLNMTMARTYRWQTEDQRDQAKFVAALVKLFRSTMGSSASLQLAGVKDVEGRSSSRSAPQPFARMERAPTPTNGAPLPPVSPRRPIANGYADVSSQNDRTSDASAYIPPTPRTSSRLRAPQTPARVDESQEFSRAVVTPTLERPDTPSRSRADTSTSQVSIPSALRPGHASRPSVSTTSLRASLSSANVVPTIILPKSPGTSRPPQPPVPTVPLPNRPNGISSLSNTSRDNLSASSPASLTQGSPLSSYANTPDTLREVPLPATLSPELSPPSRKHPSRTTSRAPSRTPTDSGQPRREQNARVSFFDLANQATLNRLLFGDVLLHGDTDPDAEGTSARENEAESAQATLDSMEEMLEGYEWASDDIMGRRTITGTDQIEARLLDELMALDKANIHSFLESDDRVNIVLKYLDDAVAELDNMDSVISSYKIHLNAVSDDIAFIQSQNRGLQVQIQNQRALVDELEELLQTVQVDKEALLALTQESLEKPASLARLEGAATELYKALQAGRDRDMAATMERLDEYRTHNSQFCKRLLDYLSIMFTAQSKLLLGDTDGVVKPARGKPYITDHKSIEEYLGRYSGLLLYMKEMAESTYGKLCAAYFSASSDLHSTQIKALLVMCIGMVKKAGDDDSEGFRNGIPATAKAPSGMRRAGTIVRSPLDRKERKDQTDGDMRSSDAFGLVLEQISNTVYREEDFITDFLHINDAALTFADYMGLENYFRRQAQRAGGLSLTTSKLVRGAMDLIFGFLPTELKAWLDAALEKDRLQIVGMIAALEKFLIDAEERGTAFLLSLLEKQHVRLKSLFDRGVTDHIKAIEDMKLTSKKRNGVAAFIKYFPTYVGRVENQLIGADTLEIRQIVDTSYDKIVQSMFEALKQMAKMDGEGEDKGQLNYHVILIENMHYFVAEVSQVQIGSVAVFLKRAQGIYDENLSAYVKIVLRRPFSKIIDYFEGIERLLKTTAPSEVSSNGSYSRSSLKKVIKEYNVKDVRKHVDTLFKRVEKHFTEASEKATTEDVSSSVGIPSGTVLVGVWKACEDELLRITELFSKRINQCYKDMGVGLEYSAADVEAAFKRQRVAA
ncbi:exocyst complex component Sec3-domain-containing protein [Amylocystis lapponica]|nr:exocyst complex component Sec3-domain-containing protein [Amylocystis lapponica]